MSQSHILSAFDRDLEVIQTLVLKMGGLVEAAILDAAEALETLDAELALKVRASVDMPLAYLGGVQSLDGAQQAIADGFDAIALGRALVFDPGFVNKLQTGEVTKSACTACNRCITMMYSC